MRDEFTAYVKRVVARRAGHCCSNPSCRRPTSGPQDDPQKAVNIGVAAHITAASPGGPRYAPQLSKDMRKSIANAIWLCQNCAKLIDDDQQHYSEKLLREWKQAAEERARELLENPSSVYDFSVAPGFLQFLDSLVAYIESLEEPRESASIERFLTWIRTQDAVPLSSELAHIVGLLEANPDSGSVVLTALLERLPDERVTEMAGQLESLCKHIMTTKQSEKEKHRLRVSARLLEIASRNLVGFGMRAPLVAGSNDPLTGTLTLRWRMGEVCPEMMLVDLVGGVLENRISVILSSNGSIILRVYDALGQETCIVSKPYAPQLVLMIAVVWDEHTLSLWIRGRQIGSRELGRKFVSPWSLVLAGIDIEGELSADVGRVGYVVDGMTGLNLGKDGIWHGARLNDIAVCGRPLAPDEIRDLALTSDQETEHLKENASVGRK